MTNKAVVQAYVDAFNARDWTGIRPLFSPDAVIYGVLGTGGVDEVIPIWRELHSGLSLHLQVEALVQEADGVVARYKETGRFVGPFRGLPGATPTQRPFEIVSMEWFEFADGKIGRRWAARDSGSITRQVLG